VSAARLAGFELLVASGNAKKLAELVALVEPLGVKVRVPADVGGLPEVDEDAPDFRGNAAKKATSGARAAGLWCLADDSGLVVPAIGGEPGVRSARYAGRHGDDAANNRALLARLAGVDDRRAAFVCVLALAEPTGRVLATFEGRVEGRILAEPRGSGGFGYDPLFAVEDPGAPRDERAFAEYSPAEKARISHRGRALAAFATLLPVLVSERAATHGST
jgi:XTP/dITP diphosphohydrolase